MAKRVQHRKSKEKRIKRGKREKSGLLGSFKMKL